MAALLDVNVLIALLNAGHLHHGSTTRWLDEHLHEGWASCPLTQNGCIRILSQTAYPNRAPAAEVAARLTEATQHPAHHFWPDAVSLLSPGLMAWSKLLTGRHITDAYLLALAVETGAPSSRWTRASRLQRYRARKPRIGWCSRRPSPDAL